MAAASNSADDAGRWRDRCLQALDELDQKDRRCAELETALQRSLARLAVVGYGLNPATDTRLDELRQAARDGAPSQRLAELVLAIAESSPDPREPQGRSARDPRWVIRTLFDELDELAGGLGELRRELAVADSLADLHRLLRELALRLAGPASGPPQAVAHAPGAAGEATGVRVLATLLDRCAGPDLVPEPIASIRQRLAGGTDPGGLMGLAEELAEWLGPALRGPGSGADPGGLPPAAGLLEQLLDRLELSPDAAGQLQALRARLGNAPGPTDLVMAVDALASLIGEQWRRVQAERREIEGFLRGVRERLLDLDSSLTLAESDRLDGLQSRRQLRDGLSQQVLALRSSLDQAADLDALRRAVESGLDAVHGRVESYLAQEEDRSRAADERIRVLAEQVTALQASSEALREQLRGERAQALRDSLTGLSNRLAYDEHVNREYARWRRHRTPLSLIVLDVDHFKQVNDRHGHQAGDRVLKVIARRLRESLRQADFVARYGGEEFVVLMPNTALAAASSVAEKLRLAIEQCPFHYGDLPVRVTVSCGVTEFGPGDAPASAFGRADRALYEAKHGGRNRCRVQPGAVDAMDRED